MAPTLAASDQSATNATIHTFSNLGTGFMDLPLGLCQPILYDALGGSLGTPPLVFEAHTHNKLIASVNQNNRRLKAKHRRPLRHSQHLKARYLILCLGT